MTDEAAETNGTTWQEEPEMCVLKTRQLLSEAESLLKDTEEMLVWFTKTTPSRHRWHAVEGQADIKEDRDTLVIEGFRFVGAASKEDLQRHGFTSRSEINTRSTGSSGSDDAKK